MQLNGKKDKKLRIVVITDNLRLKKKLIKYFEEWEYEFFIEPTSADFRNIRKLSPDAAVVDVESATRKEIFFCECFKKDFATSYVPVMTLIKRRQLKTRLGDLNRWVDEYLIKPPGALELRTRIEMMIKRSQKSFFASPLTGLPGGVVAEEVLNERIRNKDPFVAGHLDLDNFKSFNDKYGYMKGDRVLMQTAYMLSSTVRQFGDKDNFVGHIGGDDFILLTTPRHYNAICSNFICMFDTVIPFHYDETDRKKGFIKARTRSGKKRKIPMMSVTIALVLRSATCEITSLIELNERIAEVKKYLKKLDGSTYMADRRVVKKNDHLKVQVFQNEDRVLNNYEPLGQILIKENMLSDEELDDALKVHWKRGTMLGEVLTDMGYLEEEELEEALKLQEQKL